MSPCAMCEKCDMRRYSLDHVTKHTSNLRIAVGILLLQDLPLNAIHIDNELTWLHRLLV